MFLRGRYTVLATSLFLLLGIAVATADECIQIFTRRGPAVTDVLIDLSGYAFALLISFGMSRLIPLVYKKWKERARDGADERNA